MSAALSAPHRSYIRHEAELAPESGIVEVANYGRGRPGLIPLWVGEGDKPTPAFISQAAARSIADGETFYTWQRGIPELRAALAAYHERLHGRPFDVDAFSVTVGGMHALQIAVRIVAGHGDEVVIPTPAWPNFAGAIGVAGAHAVAVPMEPGDAGWFLDLDRLAAAITPRTRAIVVNSPANPTGWTARRSELEFILNLARRHDLWIIADEIYQRFVHEPELVERNNRTASFHDIMSDGDRILFVGTFSKNWSMTGWRIGWLEAPPRLGPIIENLVQYSTSGVAAFLQRGAVAALDGGDAHIAEQVALARGNRDALCAALRATNVVRLAPPPGAFYAFFKVDGLSDTRRLAMSLVDSANVGLAPGSAFGPGGADHLRLCFLRDRAGIEEAAARLARVLPSMTASSG